MSKRTPEPLNFPGSGFGASLAPKRRKRKKSDNGNSQPFPTEIPGNHVPNIKIDHSEEPETSQSPEIER